MALSTVVRIEQGARGILQKLSGLSGKHARNLRTEIMLAHASGNLIKFSEGDMRAEARARARQVESEMASDRR